MANKKSLTSLQKTYLRKIDSLTSKNSHFRDLLTIVKASDDASISQKSRIESKVYDESWINQLEIGFNAIDMIIANPRTFIKENAEVVLAGLAKKVNAQSIQHLAEHTEFVRSVDKKGNVTPDRILSISTEEDVQIFENRFVMTLINKLIIFIEKRYNFIKDHGETRDSDVLLIHNISTIDGLRYECDTRLKISKPSDDEGRGQKNAELLAKIVRLRERASFYIHCPFMIKMLGAKPVHNPIPMTNMLLKSPNYHKAYLLWKFIDAYTKLGVTYNIKETNQAFTKDYTDEIQALVLGNMLTLRSHLIEEHMVAGQKTRKRKLTPRVLLSLEDETFLDGKFGYDATASGNAALLSHKKGQMAPTPEEIAALKEKEEQKEKDALARKAMLEAKAEEMRQKALQKEAEEAAKRQAEEEEKAAKAKAKEEARQKKLEEEKALREAALEKKRQEEQAAKEAALLLEARRKVKTQAEKDRYKDISQARTVAKIAEEKRQAELAAKQEAARLAELALAKQKEEEAKKKAEEEAYLLAHPKKKKRLIVPLVKDKPVSKGK
jgi:hypothetical protein